MTQTKAQAAVISYLQQISKGVINISQLHAQEIIELVQQKTNTIDARAEMYQYNNAYKRYDHLRTILVSNETIDKAIKEAVKHRPIEQFIKYELFNSNNELEGNIYTVDACFFDKI